MHIVKEPLEWLALQLFPKFLPGLHITQISVLHGPVLEEQLFVIIHPDFSNSAIVDVQLVTNIYAGELRINTKPIELAIDMPMLEHTEISIEPPHIHRRNDISTCSAP